MKPLSLAISLILFTAAASQAATETFDASYTSSFSGSTDLLLPQFDTLGGSRVLDSFTFSFNSTVGSHITVENDSASPASQFIVNFNGSMSGTVIETGASAAQTLSFSFDPLSLAASDGTPKSGPDFADLGTFSRNLAASLSSTTSGLDLTPYIGTGDLTIRMRGVANYDFSGSNDATLKVSDSNASGIASITYNYHNIVSAVPEPSSAVLLSIGFLLFFRRRDYSV